MVKRIKKKKGGGAYAPPQTNKMKISVESEESKENI
jgi:hypothetical protein